MARVGPAVRSRTSARSCNAQVPQGKRNAVTVAVRTASCRWTSRAAPQLPRPVAFNKRISMRSSAPEGRS